MDRQYAYPGALPQDDDVMLTNRNVLKALGLFMADVLGVSTIAAGLPCTATAPPGMTVNVGIGRLYQYAQTDVVAYGDLSTDSDMILKQGILAAPVNLSCPAPATSGFSTNYLIEATFAEVDGAYAILEYYNDASPNSPLNGPGGDNTSQPTKRQGLITIQVKAGTAAATGTQTTPAADANFVGLFVVTVAQGQTTITSSSIALASAAPFLTESLTQKISAATAQTLYAPIAAPHSDLFVVGSGGVTSGQTVFALSATPPSAAYLTVVVDGATLLPSDYSLTGSSLTLSTGITTGQSMVARYGAAVLALVPSSGVVTDAMLSSTSIVGGVSQKLQRTEAEISASITPLNPAYPELHLWRYGSVGAGTLADQTALQSAIAVATAKGSGEIYGPAGSYLWSLATAAVLPAGVTFKGDGPYATVFTTNNVAGQFFNITGTGAAVRDVGFTSSVVNTSGTFVTVAGTENRFENWRISNHFIGFTVTGVAAKVRHGWFGANAGGGRDFIMACGDASPTVMDILGEAQSAPYPASGATLENCTAGTFINVNLINRGACLAVIPGAGQSCDSNDFIGGFLDSGTTAAFIQPTSATGNVGRLHFLRTWLGDSSGGTAAGVLINNTPAATFTGTIVGTALTVSSVTGTIAAGQVVLGANVTPSTTIVSGSGTSWVVNESQNVGPFPMCTCTNVVDGIEFTACDMAVNASVGLSTQGAVGSVRVNGGLIAGNTQEGVFANHYGALQIKGTRIGASDGLNGNAGGGIALGANLTKVNIECDVSQNATFNISDSTTSGIPKIIQNCPGYTPVSGGISVGGSPFSWPNNTGAPAVVFVQGSSVSGVLVGGLSVTSPLNGQYILAPGKTIQVTYSGATPTMDYQGLM